MLIPHDVERLVRQDSSASVAAKSASCFLAVCDSFTQSLSEMDQKLVILALDALTEGQDSMLLEESEKLEPRLERLRAGGGKWQDNRQTLQLLHALLRAAGTFEKKDAVRLCVLSADWARENDGESGDLEWVLATWAETSGQ